MVYLFKLNYEFSISVESIVNRKRSMTKTKNQPRNLRFGTVRRMPKLVRKTEVIRRKASSKRI